MAALMLGLVLILLILATLCFIAPELYQRARRREGEPWYLIPFLPAWYHKAMTRFTARRLPPVRRRVRDPQAGIPLPPPKAPMRTITSLAVFAALALAATPAGAEAQRPRASAIARENAAIADTIEQLDVRTDSLVVRLATVKAEHACLQRIPSDSSRIPEVLACLTPASPAVAAQVHRPPNRTALRTDHTSQKSIVPGALFLGTLATGVAANAYFKLDIDRTVGDRPSFDRWSGYHFVGGFAIESAAEEMGVPLPLRIVGVCAASYANERLTSRQFDGNARADAKLGCGGAVASAAFRAVARAVR